MNRDSETTSNGWKFILLMYRFSVIVTIALRRSLHNHGNIATEGSPKPGLRPTHISNDFKRSFYCTVYHRQHGKLQDSEELGALYMHNHDDKYSARPGFEPGTSRLEAPVDTNESSGPSDWNSEIV